MTTQIQASEGSKSAMEASVKVIEQTLGDNKAFRRVEEHLYVIKQGSAIVMLVVLPAKRDRAIVRFAAQVVTGIEMTGSLARKLLKINSRLRFGAFGFQEQSKVVTLSHSILGGETLDPEEILAALEDIALLADEFDDKLVAAGGGARMQDLIEDEAASRLHAELESQETSWDEEN